MKPVIKVWCLPKQTQSQLEYLHYKIVEALEKVEHLGLKGENSFIIIFPPDSMEYGLGKDIHIEVSEVAYTNFDSKIRLFISDVARCLVTTVKEFFPHAYVQCRASTVDLHQATWSSNVEVRMERRPVEKEG